MIFLGGETNANGTILQNPRDWGSIEFGVECNANFKNVTLRYAGFIQKGCLYTNGVSITVQNSTLTLNYIRI